MYVRYISHEVRTPLNAVNMGLQYLITEASETLSNASADLLDSLITSKSACSKAIGILDDLLLIDSIEDGRLPIFTETVSAKEIIEDSLTLFTAQVSNDRSLLVIIIHDIRIPISCSCRRHSLFVDILKCRPDRKTCISTGTSLATPMMI